MKRFALFVLLIALAFLAFACSPVAQSRAVQLPVELVALLGMVVMVAITAGAKWLGDKIGVDLSDRAGEIASAVAAVLVLVINYFLGLVPAAYDNLISALFAFLIIFLGGAGFFALFLRRKVRASPKG